MNNIVKNILSADAQLFADDGVTWAPNPKREHRNAMSFGFGFTAVAVGDAP
jgi:hypothetical protein